MSAGAQTSTYRYERDPEQRIPVTNARRSSTRTLIPYSSNSLRRLWGRFDDIALRPCCSILLKLSSLFVESPSRATPLNGMSCAINSQVIDGTKYCQVAVSALILYEYVITLKHEYRNMWRGTRSFGTVLLFINRYVLLVFGLCVFLQTFPCSNAKSCKTIGLIYGVSQVLLFALIAVFSALRVYALSGRRWILASITLILALVPAGINLYAVIRQRFTSIACISCMPEYTEVELSSAAMSERLIIAAYISMIVSDLIVLGTTWICTRGSLSMHGLACVLLRHGAIYFLALLCLNILQISVRLTKICSVSLLFDYCHSVGYVTYFIAPLSSILISRLFFSLRQTPRSVFSDTTNILPSLAFASNSGPIIKSDAELGLGGVKEQEVWSGDAHSDSGEVAGQDRSDLINLAEDPFTAEVILDSYEYGGEDDWSEQSFNAL